MDRTENRHMTAGVLREHVARLAGSIGERNVFRPGALAAAADYIEGHGIDTLTAAVATIGS